MHFALTEEQHQLIATVRSLVARRAATVDLRAAISSAAGYDTELWRTLCEQVGVAALAIPEEYGGAGFSSFETHLVLEELGATLTPSPLLGSGVLATQALLRSRNAEACRRLLPDLASGATTAALCWGDLQPFELKAPWASETMDHTWVIDGITGLVLDGSEADVLFVIAEMVVGTYGLFEVDPNAPGVTRQPLPALDPTLRFAEITFDHTPASALSLTFRPEFQALRAIAASALSALQTGGARRALDLTVAHLKDREQFGRPLASFQALKHRCADLVVDVETATSVSWAGSWAIAQAEASGWMDPALIDDATRQSSIAKAWCTDAFNHVASEMIQLHGGIAITWEHDAHLYFKRAQACAQLFGPPSERRAEAFELR